MDQRPNAVGRGPLGDGTPGLDPATDAFEPDAVRDPALGGTDMDPVAGDPVEVDEVEATRVEIERTKAGMSGTVDAIQERLFPQNLKEWAKDRVKEATVGRAREARAGVVETIRAIPLPATLTGIGLGWLLMSARQQSQPRYRDDVYRYRTPTNEYAREVDEYPVAPKYLHREGDEGTSAGDLAGHARDRVGETATHAQDKAGDLGSRARYQANVVGGGLQRMLNDNPLTMGVLAIGTGAAIGLAIPETSKEHEVMGEARDTVVEKAQEVQQSVQRVAEEAQGAAQQEAAENQGLKYRVSSRRYPIVGAAKIGHARGVWERRTDDTMGTRSGPWGVLRGGAHRVRHVRSADLAFLRARRRPHDVEAPDRGGKRSSVFGQYGYTKLCGSHTIKGASI